MISRAEELVHSLTEPVCDNLWLLEQQQPKCLTASVQGLAKPHLESLKVSTSKAAQIEVTWVTVLLTELCTRVTEMLE